MKHLLIGLSLITLIAAGDRYGKKISPKGAITLEEMMTSLGDKTSMETKVSGTVKGVCKVKGCWMTMTLPNGEDMRVTFKDYGFFMPLDCEGSNAIIQGTVNKTITSVDDLRHYAKDGGASEAEIAKITEPKEELAFEAVGVILKK